MKLHFISMMNLKMRKCIISAVFVNMRSLIGSGTVIYLTAVNF